MQSTVGVKEIRISGQNRYVPSSTICGREVIVVPKWLRVATIHDEELVEGPIVGDRTSFVDGVRNSGLRADVLNFAGEANEEPPPGASVLSDNWAVAPTTSYTEWWENLLPQESRKNARRAAKRGVIVKSAAFDDEFVRGVQGIYDETPVRQGRPFWHYRKDFETVKRENATYPERSDFIGAYFENELIGFIKLIYVNRSATLIQILSKVAHQDKKPTNALLAKAVEICAEKGISSLIYGKYTYNEGHASALTEFKRRNGFAELCFPRYYVPLTPKGRLAVRLGLHLGLRNIIPRPLLTRLLRLRARVYRGGKNSPEQKPASDREGDGRDMA